MGKTLRKIVAGIMALASMLGFAAAQAPAPVSAQALVAKLQAAGLEATAPQGMVGADYGNAPFVCKGVRFGLPSYGEAAVGRAFYCARRADRERLARYYIDLGKRDPEQFTHVFVNAPFVLVLAGDVADESAADYEAVLKGTWTQTKSTASGSAPAPANATPGFRVEIQKAGYEQWGRPEVMDNPNFHGWCRGDDSRPVLKLGISLAIYNTSPTPWPTNTRNVKFYKTDGTPAASCWYDYMDDKAYPPTTMGNAWIASYTVFVEKSERVGYGIFKVDGIGDVRFDIPQNLPMP
ncbi:MAG: hypothetical protein NTZ50_03805 [Chloroflexi bacterium]|nr:hypothetical protein [Chloroflexota bacterium]